MALFQGTTPSTKYPRSNTKLVVSGGDSPAEKWIVKEGLTKLFDYPYGDAGQTEVVISKGMMVAATGKLIRDYDTSRWIPEITIADGTNACIGMAPYNFAPQVKDKLTGNQPSIITREYVELPYFPVEADAEKCLWGLVYGTVKPGDFLKVSTALPGKLTKWDPASDGRILAVGQVLALEPHANSWLEWAMWNDAAKKEDDAYINRSGVSAPSDAGYPFDPEYRKLGGSQDMLGYLSQYTTQPTGLYGITDGAEARKTVFRGMSVGLTIPDNATIGTTFMFQAPTKYLVNDANLKIYIGEVEVTAADIVAKDLKNGFFTIKVPSDGEAAPAAVTGAVTMDYKTMSYGTPAYWNFEGAAGAVRLLLKF